MFYVVIMKSDSQSIVRYESQVAALAAFYTEMAYALNSGINTTCYVTDEYGRQLQRERYEVSEPNESGNTVVE